MGMSLRKLSCGFLLGVGLVFWHAPEIEGQDTGGPRIPGPPVHEWCTLYLFGGGCELGDDGSWLKCPTFLTPGCQPTEYDTDCVITTPDPPTSSAYNCTEYTNFPDCQNGIGGTMKVLTFPDQDCITL